MMPNRIQLRRTKGRRLPAGAVVVSRPSRWGNPFRSLGECETIMCDASHRRTILTPWVCFRTGGAEEHSVSDNEERAREVLALYRRWLRHEFNAENVVRPCPYTIDDVRAALAGKDLACWCPLDKPCHADVLLEIANAR